MNLEQLFKIFVTNYDRIPNKKRAWAFVKECIRVVQWRKSKLKLGAIVFDFKYTIVAGITIMEEIEMRYIRQDTSHEEELKFENRLKALQWKTDVYNIVALFVVMFVGYCYFRVWWANFLFDNFPAFVGRDIVIDESIKLTFESMQISNSILQIDAWYFSNSWIFNTLTDMVIKFDII